MIVRGELAAEDARSQARNNAEHGEVYVFLYVGLLVSGVSTVSLSRGTQTLSSILGFQNSPIEFIVKA